MKKYVSVQKQRRNRISAKNRRKHQNRVKRAVTVLFAAALLFGFWTLFMNSTHSKQSAHVSESAGIQKLSAVQDNRKETGPKESGPAAQDWRLTLVNPWTTVPDQYQIVIKQLQNGHAVDERCYPDLQQMMDDCRYAGLEPLICSSYRSWEAQEQLFSSQVNGYIEQGYSQQEAREEAAKIVAVPGTSEHQLGLAVDIVDVNNQNLNDSQENTEVQRWLMQNSWRYGFVLRYPSNKSHITGIVYEPWHYRYVGKETAKIIYEQKICLEEYLAELV